MLANEPVAGCLLDQRLRRVVGESDVFQSVIAQFALKLREGQYHFDTPSDLVGLKSNGF